MSRIVGSLPLLEASTLSKCLDKSQMSAGIVLPIVNLESHFNKTRPELTKFLPRIEGDSFHDLEAYSNFLRWQISVCKDVWKPS